MERNTPRVMDAMSTILHRFSESSLMLRFNGGSIMVGNRCRMPPPRQFQPMFQVSSRQSMKLLCCNPEAKIQLDIEV